MPAEFDEIILASYGRELVRHRQITRNYGLKGGLLVCDFYTFRTGDPTGITRSWIEQ